MKHIKVTNVNVLQNVVRDTVNSGEIVILTVGEDTLFLHGYLLSVYVADGKQGYKCEFNTVNELQDSIIETYYADLKNIC